jgi:hypothetical protein
MSVEAAPGSVAVPAANATGSVLCTWDAPEVVADIPPSPPAGTNRIDLIVCQPHGQDLDGGAVDDFVIMSVTGAEAATPVAPALPAGAVALAQVRINGGAAAIAAGDITDTRPGLLAVPGPVETTKAPRGHIQRLSGPASAVDAVGAFVNIVVLNVAVVAGRWYRLAGYGYGTQSTATSGNCQVIGLINNDQATKAHVNISRSLPAGQQLAGCCVSDWQAPATTTVPFALQAFSSPGALHFDPGTCWISAEDLGA